eukprot:Skav206340  [mRNA]  locus=scaffold1420:525939:526722:+ [translate_table: standard]
MLVRIYGSPESTHVIEAMDRAIEVGDVVQFQGDDGRDYYKFRRMTVGQERGAENSHGGQDETKADPKHFGSLKEIVTKLEWTFDHTDKHDFAKDDGKIPKQIETLLNQAKGALDKLSKDSIKCLQKDANKLPDGGKKLRNLYSQAQKDLHNIEHVRMFKELPDQRPLTKATFDACVMAVAEHVEQLNEELETTKALIKARSN